MRICNKCGAELNDTQKFCNQCGTPVPQNEGPRPAKQIVAPQNEATQSEATQNEAPKPKTKPLVTMAEGPKAAPRPRPVSPVPEAPKEPTTPSPEPQEVGQETTPPPMPPEEDLVPPRPRRNRTPLIILVIVLALLIVGGAVWFLFLSEDPLIKSEEKKTYKEPTERVNRDRRGYQDAGAATLFDENDRVGGYRYYYDSTLYDTVVVEEAAPADYDYPYN